MQMALEITEPPTFDPALKVDNVPGEYFEAGPYVGIEEPAGPGFEGTFSFDERGDFVG